MRSCKNVSGALFFVLLTIFPAVLFLNCATTMKIPSLADNPDCVTSLEGYYYFKEPWAGPKPALILSVTPIGRSQARASKVIAGEIVSRNENGVTFRETKDNGSSDSQPVYYAFSEIEALIDEEGGIAYGSLPLSLLRAPLIELYLEPVFSYSYSSNSKPLRMKLQPNDQFAFCIPAGNYRLSEILFIDRSSNVDIGVDYPALSITIEPECANYMGHLFFDYAKPQIPDSLFVPFQVSIPYKILSRPKGATVAGLLGGALGGALYGASLAEKGTIGNYKVFIGVDKNYRSICKSPAKQNTIKIMK